MPPTGALDQRELGAERAHVVALLPAEGVGGDDVQRVTLRRADEGERHARAAARVLDYRAAGREPAVALGGLDHRERHAVLHAAGGILVFELDENARAPLRGDPPEWNEPRLSRCGRARSRFTSP